MIILPAKSLLNPIKWDVGIYRKSSLVWGFGANNDTSVRLPYTDYSLTPGEFGCRSAKNDWLLSKAEVSSTIVVSIFIGKSVNYLLFKGKWDFCFRATKSFDKGDGLTGSGSLL